MNYIEPNCTFSTLEYRILNLTQSSRKRKWGQTEGITAEEKLNEIKKILNENPELPLQSSLVNKILDLTNKCVVSEKAFRRELVFRCCVIEKQGIRIIKNDDLAHTNEYKSLLQTFRQEGCVLKNHTLFVNDEFLGSQQHSHEFWAFIEEHQVKQLLVSRKGRDLPEVYSEAMLQSLLRIKPNPMDFIEEYFLEFPSVEIVTESKAKLRLCGKLFELFFADINQISEKIISLPYVPYQGFKSILQLISTGQWDSDDLIEQEDFRQAASYLQFNKTIPKGHVYGELLWKTFWGEIGPVNPLPEDIFDPCPLHNPEKSADGPRIIDSHDLIWLPDRVNGQELTIDVIRNPIPTISGLNDIEEEILLDPVVNSPLPKGYWYAIPKNTPKTEALWQFTVRNSFEEQENYLKEEHSLYKVASPREILLYRIIQRFNFLQDSRFPAFCINNTVCKETINGQRLAILTVYVNEIFKIDVLSYNDTNVLGEIQPVLRFT